MCIDLCGAAPGMLSCQEQAPDPRLCPSRVLLPLCTAVRSPVCPALPLSPVSPFVTVLSEWASRKGLWGDRHNPASFPDPRSDCWLSGQSTAMEVGGHPAHKWPGASAVLAHLLPPARCGKADGPSSAEGSHTDGGPQKWCCAGLALSQSRRVGTAERSPPRRLEGGRWTQGPAGSFPLGEACDLQN